MFSESFDDKPDVGSSRNRIAGSRISSSAMFNRFLCPPLISFYNSSPTMLFLRSNKPRLWRTLSTFSIISSSVKLSKQSFAL